MWFGVLYATAFVGTIASLHAADGRVLAWWFSVAAWLALFIAGATSRILRRRRGERLEGRSADEPRPGNPLDGDDGRRWRSGMG